MNLKHELFAQALIRYRGNQARAYMEVYPNCNKKSAPSKASRLVRKGSIIRRVREILHPDEHEFRLIFGMLASGLKATKPLKAGKKVIFVSDNRARLNAIKIALKLYGLIR
jgi:hypothetical protein